MDFKKGLFTLSVADGTVITPTQVRKAVRDKFKIPTIEVDGLVGTVRKSKGGRTAMMLDRRNRAELTDAKGKSAVAKLESGQTVKVSGALIEKGEKDKKRLTIQVAKAEPVQTKKPKRTS